MAKYTTEQFRSIFQNRFNREAWKAIVVEIFGANKIRTENERFTGPDEPETGYYMGTIDTPDHYHIGLFYYKINAGSVAHKKVGLRNLVKRFINQNWGEFDAAIVVFDDGKEWRLSFVCDIKEEATAPKRFTFVFGEHDNFYRTAIERFSLLQGQQPTFENIRKAFSVEALSDEFFDTYRELYADFVQYLTGKRYVKEGCKWIERELSKPNYQFQQSFESDEKLVRDYVKKMFGRIVFLYFLQRKGWLNSNRQYMHELFTLSDKKDDFLDGVLEPLFFEVLNTDKPYRTSAAKALPGSENIPYLNGGLFAKDDVDDRTCIFPAEYFGKLFDFLDSYNFTIDENDTDDAEIGIDPEMLGRIFENLLEDNKDKGAFYTPKEIVQYMCRESIIAYLLNGLPERSHELIRRFVETLDASDLNAEQRLYIRKKLQAVKICDPAIGSGAFPMGLVNLLSKLYVAMKSDTDTAKMKRHIMERNIYGVDIEKGAVDIARLRFWLAMIVEEKEPIPLPNLHFKIMQGNSLLESYNNIDLSCLTEINIGKPGDLELQNEEAKSLISSLGKFYNVSDHDKRIKIFNDIIYNVQRQIYELTQSEEFMSDVKDISANDKFFLWHTWFADVFANGGFDIVIGNPPYLKEGRANKAIFETVKHSPYYQGKMDIWYMFACLGLDMLKTDGNLCFIATNNWVTSTGAKKLRQKINTDAQILQLCDFKNYMIFKTASIQTMIMQFKKNWAEQSYQFDLRNLLGSDFEDVIKLLNKEQSPTTQFLEPTYNRMEIKDRYITFSKNDCLLDKVKNADNAIFLNESEIIQGIVPNPDVVNSRNIKRFSEEEISKHEIQIGDPVFIVPKKFFLNLSNQEKNLLKPIFEPVDFTKYTLRSSSSDIIYLTKSNSPTEFDMPNILSHLTKYRPIMEERRENQQGRIKYYHLHWPREQETFDYGEKILVPRKCSTPIFCYTEMEAYVMMAINVIKTIRVDMKYLSGLLNSKLIAFWLRNRGKMQGLNYQLDKEPLQQIPIAVPEIVVQATLGRIVKEIINRKSADENASIQDLENQIDNIVYHVYNMTYDEVLIVDPEITITREEYESTSIVL